VYCAHAFHGLSYGALSLTDDPNFRGGFEPLLPGCTSIPFNDLAALEQALSSRQVAAFIVEPIQGKGVNMPTDEFLPGAAALCRKYGTLLIADEIQTGVGRTGRFLAVEHWNVEPDMVLLAKALSGGHVPVGALLTRKSIFDKIFNQMDRAVVHGSTFAKNDLAMAAGIATLEVIEAEKLVEQAAKRGAELRLALTRMVPGYELMKEVRGKGLMIGVEFGPPKSLRLKASWNLLETANKGLFCQLITAVQGPQDPDPGLRPRQPHHQAAAAADHHARRLHLDRDRVRFRYRLQPQGPRRDLVAGQDPGGQRGAQVGVGNAIAVRLCRSTGCPVIFFTHTNRSNRAADDFGRASAILCNGSLSCTSPFGNARRFVIQPSTASKTNYDAPAVQKHVQSIAAYICARALASAIANS
jgi:hypothetical protein